MEMDVLTNLISTVAFPIAMCVLMAFYVKYQGDQHKQEMDKISSALDNNTIALTKLVEKIERE